jgi:CitMHS family citrate-Mg2+:H+ or citrate-Ca2+:H+ symporter
MIALLGFLMMSCFIFLIVTRRMSALLALIVVPLIFAIIGGFGKDLGSMILEGLSGIAPTGIMLMFAVLYFGVMIDAGLFDPLVSKILSIVKGDPLKVVIGTAVLASLVALDGDGTTTYMPREVFKSEILNNNASIIVSHQHPSQDIMPSREDIEVTKR